jgi:hypothetical protein
MENFLELYSEELFEFKEPSRQGVLGTVVGPGFFPNVPSRNRRVYPTEAWNNALTHPQTKRLLESNLMLGTVGHEDLDFDKLINEQKVSHVTRKLWIEEKSGKSIGMIEADILDTPVGRILNTLLRAGCKMAVSSKSYGEYQESKDPSGNQIVDPKKFYCQRFDFVVDPGFLEAMPQLREAFDNAITTNNNTKSIDESRVIELIEEKFKKEKDFIYCNKSSKIDTDSITEGNKDMDEKLLKLIEEKTRLEEQIGQVLKENESQKNVISGLQALGTPEAIKEAFDKVNSLTESLKLYEEIGTVDEIKESFGKVKEFVTSLEQFGTIADIAETFESIQEYVEIGTVDEIQESLEKTKDLVEKLEEIGSYASIKEALERARDVLKEYAEIGKPDEIRKAFESTNKVLDDIKAKNEKRNVDELIATFSISEEKAKTILTKMSLEEAKTFLTDMVESVRVTDRYKRSDKKMNEDKKEDTVMPNRTSRLFESFGARAQS